MISNTVHQHLQYQQIISDLGDSFSAVSHSFSKGTSQGFFGECQIHLPRHLRSRWCSAFHSAAVDESCEIQHICGKNHPWHSIPNIFHIGYWCYHLQQRSLPNAIASPCCSFLLATPQGCLLRASSVDPTARKNTSLPCHLHAPLTWSREHLNLSIGPGRKSCPKTISIYFKQRSQKRNNTGKREIQQLK